MAAGDLENIRPTSPDQGIAAARTRNIWLCDTSGSLHSVKAVYWSPTNNAEDLKLIWLRDHNTNKKLVIDQSWQENKIRKFTAPSDLAIKAIRTLTNTTNDGGYGKCAYIIDVETGLTIGWTDTEGISYSSTTKYDCEGYYRTWQFADTIYLQANKEYYICCFYLQSDRPHPIAYFENETVMTKAAPTSGSNNFSNVRNNGHDLRGLAYDGTVSASASKDVINAIMNGDADAMQLNISTVDDGDVFNTPAIKPYGVYVKNSAYSANAWSGIVPADRNQEDGKGPTLETLADMSSGDMALTDKETWDPNPGGIVFRRTNEPVTKPDVGPLNMSSSATIRAAIINDLQFSNSISSHTFIISSGIDYGLYPYSGILHTNGLYQTNSGQIITSALNIDYSTPPENPVENCLYWKSSQWNGIPSWTENCIVQYKNGSWNYDISAWFTELNATGYSADFDKINDAYIKIGTSNSAVLTASESQGKKYYFEVVTTADAAIEV